MGAGPVYPVSLGGGLSFTFSDSLSLLVSEEAGLAEVQLGEWGFEKEEKVYRLPEGTAAAMVRYAQEHHCLGREESLAPLRGGVGGVRCR